MATILADKASIYMRAPTAEAESEIVGKAQMFGFVVLEDVVVVKAGEGELFKKVTIFSDRARYQDFKNLVWEVITLVGKGQGEVLLEVNGVASVYKGGVDYESSGTRTPDEKPSVGSDLGG